MTGHPLIINILGNSLALASPKQNIYYGDTYAFKIARGLGLEDVVVNRARRNNTIVDQTIEVNIQDDIIHIQADYHIVHLGIVDCAPRLFTRREQKLLSLLPFKKKIIRFASKHRLFFTKTFPKVYVKKDRFGAKFRHLLEIILRSTRTKKIFLINLAATKERNIHRSFGIERNIQKYNAVLDEIAKEFPEQVFLINFYELTTADPTFVAEDGIHITHKGHKALSDILCHLILENEGRNSAVQPIF